MRRRSFLAGLSTASLTIAAGCAALTGDSSTVEPTIEVDTPALRDESTPPRLVGFTPETRVSVTATVTDGDGVEWQSENTFTADEDGTIDLASQAPVDGTYDGVDPMGWLWSMTPPEESTLFSADGDETAIRLTASSSDTADEPDAATTVTRRHRTDGVTKTEVDTDNLVGVYFEPAGSGPHPGALALHGSSGSPATNVAELLASHGYATFAPQYFGQHDAIPSRLAHVPLEYFDDAVDWLTAKPGVENGDVGVWGGSRGGELALLLGAHFDWAGAVVSRNGSGVVWNSNSSTTESAWSVDGEPLPHLSFDILGKETTDDGYIVYRGTYVSGYEKAEAAAVADATIPVENIDAPTLLIAGADDQLWPSAMLAEHALERIREHDIDFRFAVERYADAGHFILPPYRPTNGTQYFAPGMLLVGGTPAGNAAAAADAWPKVLDCFERGLGDG